jgi:ABC-type antimicrobial peptide transport system permease subunit
VFGTLLMAFGAVALPLASVGLYGVMSFVVARRTQEMGIRMAMGARGGELAKLMLNKGVVQLAIGLVIGLGIAALAAGPLQFVLFEGTHAIRLCSGRLLSLCPRSGCWRASSRRGESRRSIR